MRAEARGILRKLGIALLYLAAWEAVSLIVGKAYLVPSPFVVFRRFGAILLDGESWMKAGMTLGGVVGIRASDSTPVFIESGLYYTERGGKEDNKSVGYNNLDIPLIVKYGIKATDDIAVLPFVGPYIARACWGETKLVDGSKVGTFDEDKWSALERVNWGFKIGCGAEYNMLYLEVGYQIGVNDISKNGNYTAHSNALFANFGVNF